MPHATRLMGMGYTEVADTWMTRFSYYKDDHQAY